MYYRHQVHGTRPSPKRGKHAVLEVKDLEGGEEFTIDTEHAVLNIPTEASYYSLVFGFRDGVCCRLEGAGGRGRLKAEKYRQCDCRAVISRRCPISSHGLASRPWPLPRGVSPRMPFAFKRRPCWQFATHTTAL